MLNNTAPLPAILDDIGPPSWCYETRFNGWNAAPDVYIPDYWKQFRAPAPYLHYMLGILYICLMSVAVLGNSIVMYIFCVFNGWNAAPDVYIPDYWKQFRTPAPYLHYMLGILYICLMSVAVLGNSIVMYIFCVFNGWNAAPDVYIPDYWKQFRAPAPYLHYMLGILYICLMSVAVLGNSIVMYIFCVFNGWNAAPDVYIPDYWKQFRTPAPYLHYMLGILYICLMSVAVLGNSIVMYIFCVFNGWNAAPDVYIPDYWRQFRAPAPYLHYMLGILYICLMSVAVLGNSIVMYIFCVFNGWNAAPDVYIPDYWKQFRAPAPYLHYMLGILYICLMSVAVLGNSIVMYIFCVFNGWNAAPDVYIPDYWKQFRAPAPYLHYMLGILYICLMSVAVLGNSIVMYIFCVFNGWNAAPDVYIPDYWKQFRAPAPYLHYMLGILYICLMSVAVLGNSIVMYIFCVFNGWNAAPDVYIPDYWKQFRAPAPYLHYMLGILYICLMSVAVLGNSIVMYIFCVFNGWNAAPDVYIPDYWKQFRAPAPYLHYMLGILYICLMSVAVLGNSIVMYIFCVFNGWNAAPDVYIPDYWKQFRAPAPYLHYMLGILYICLMSVAVLGNSIVMYIFCVFNGWNAAPDVYIPDYWRQFRAPAPYLHYMLGILYICLMSVAVLGNSIVMYIFCVFNGWNAAPDVYIPDYWKQFRAPAPYLHYMLGILYICLMSVAVLGNSIVMYIFCVFNGWNAAPDVYIPDYWKQFRAPAPYLHYMLGILYICLMSVAVLGNSIVMYIFCVFNGWNAAPDVYIPDYWKQFRAPAPYLHYMLGILYICLMSVAVLGNSIVMYIFCVFNGWNAAPDVYIPDYWKQFRAPAPYLHYMLGILYICLMSVAVLGNSIVMYIFCVFNGWNAAPDVYIPDYWKQFRAPAPYLHYMLGILYICLMSVAVLGNSIVMYIFCVFNGWNAAPDVYIPDYWKQFRAPAPYLHYMLGILYICLMSVAVLGNSIVMYIFCVFNGWNAAPDVYIPDYWKQFRAPAPYLHYMLGILYICLMSVAVLGNSIVMYIFCVFNGWNAAPDVYIPDYWKQFRAPAPYLHYMLGILYICLMSVAVLGNSIVMYIFCVSKSLRTPTNMFVIGLALADLLMMSKTPVFIYNCFHLGPVFGQIGCDIYAVVGTYSGIGSAFCNAVIAYDRYRVICHPFSKSGMTMTKAIAILVIVYLYITPFAILPALKIWSRFVPEGFLTSCAADFFMQDFNGRSYIVGTWFFGWFIPVMAIIFFYAQIFLAVKDHENKIKEQARKMNVDSIRSNEAVKNSSAEVRIAKTACCVMLMFLISWVPYILVAFITGFSDPKLKRITPVISMIPAMTIKGSACFDPFFYAISHPRYRMELQNKLPWLCINEKAEASGAGDDSVSKTTEHVA